MRKLMTAAGVLIQGLLALAYVQTGAAEPAHRWHRRPPPLQKGHTVDRAPGWEIRALTERAQNEPGLTAELSPGAKQTATGGPSGGVPGFSGH